MMVVIAGFSGAGLEVTAASDECSLSQVETRPEAAIEPCSKIIADKATSPADRGYALYIRGRAYHNTKCFDLAGRDYDAAIPLTPTNEELFVSRANIAFRAKRYQEGVSFLQDALALNPSNGHALRTLGALNGDMGNLDEAERYYAMALTSDPNDAYALFFRSKNNAKRRQFDEALKDADALVAIAPDAINRQGFLDGRGDHVDFHILALKNRADIYDALGRPDRAEQDLNAAVTYSRSPASLSARGVFLAGKPGREKEALADLGEAIALGSVDTDTFYAKGVLHAQLNQMDEALAVFDRVLAIYPDFAGGLHMRARIHRELDQTELAVTDMAHAVTISRSMLEATMPALRNAGYWRSDDDPSALTPAFEDAIRACMIDKRCN
ncbi:tetratricopeptide repeat protein [Bradyrhizobium sp. NP1]|uniref:tetratricopeptide repeat protein n=1 Tax=Bradyrhizobium sp. NP1 TaxID=3049772 RepID=UPI0025A65E2C|nr:tetratricopeptide repeat protein [Bradyrhizobium sp. NP1]WJR75049.1 tetratricopeptide repeat protein [Bradyrhizobium sp. NP1]